MRALYVFVCLSDIVDLCWNMLMEPVFTELRSCIYTNADEFKRFRQILVNIVLATDIMDKELGAARKKRWEVAFANSKETTTTQSLPSPDNDDVSAHDSDTDEMAINRKATIVLEHLIQASDVSHTMQHWHVFRKWNQRLFCEVYECYLAGRMDTDPSVGWYKGEIGKNE